LVAKETPETITFSVPASKVKITIPNTQLVKQSANPTNSYRYFNYSGKTSGFTISGWFEPASLFKGLKYSWTQFLKEWSGSTPENIQFSSVGSWEVVTYSIATGPCVQSSLRANVVKNGTWVELHLSSPCNKSMNLKEYLERILVE
jgi:hypothetical protein